MQDDIVLNKMAVIERCLARIREEYQNISLILKRIADICCIRRLMPANNCHQSGLPKQYSPAIAGYSLPEQEAILRAGATGSGKVGR